LEEQFEILTGLWATERDASFEHHGKQYELTGGTGLPKPVQQPHPPIIVGGFGPKRTPALAARFAQEFNAPFAEPDATGEQFARVRAACEAADRDPSTMTWSAAQVVCVGADDAEVARRATAIGREPAELRDHGVAGTPEQARARLAALAEVGVERVYLQVLDLADLDHLALIAAELAGPV
jgi:alkanesulfonate monooxygenase SsuD/methylene tetrahydromethanopterin reductase-like flavin-dependent oxidoreductase (luciferase family)